MKSTNRFKLVILVVLLFLLGLFIILNTQTVELNFVVAKVSLSRALMLILVLLAGFAAGWIARSFGSLRDRFRK